MSIDRYNLAILTALQLDGRISIKNLADRVDLSTAPCWRRVKRLEEEGYIEKYTALVNPGKLGMQITAFAEICLDNHHGETVAAFNQAVKENDNILECHSVSGQCDYLLKIVARDMQSYEYFLSKELLLISGIRSVNTLFSLKQHKFTMALPLG